VYRTGDGNYSQLPDRQPAKETREQGTTGNVPDEGNIFSWPFRVRMPRVGWDESHGTYWSV